METGRTRIVRLSGYLLRVGGPRVRGVLRLGDVEVEVVAPQRLFHGHQKAWSYFKVALIGIACALVTTFANNERTDQRVNELARKEAVKRIVAIRAADKKIQDAKELAQRLAIQQSRYSNNKLVCVLRTISSAQIERLEFTKSKGYKEAESFWKQILDNAIPIPNTPSTCATLPARPPAPVPTP